MPCHIDTSKLPIADARSASRSWPSSSRMATKKRITQRSYKHTLRLCHIYIRCMTYPFLHSHDMYELRVDLDE